MADPTFQLLVRPVPRGLDHLGRPPEARLKALLKIALRSLGMRVEVVQVATDRGGILAAAAGGAQ